MKRPVLYFFFCFQIFFFRESQACKVIFRISNRDCIRCWNFAFNINRLPDYCDRILLFGKDGQDEMKTTFHNFANISKAVKVIFSDSFYNTFDDVISSTLYVFNENRKEVYSNTLQKASSTTEFAKIKDLIHKTALSEPDKIILANTKLYPSWNFYTIHNKLFLYNVRKRNGVTEYNKIAGEWKKVFDYTLSDSLIKILYLKKITGDPAPFEKYLQEEKNTMEAGIIGEEPYKISGCVLNGDTLITSILVNYVYKKDSRTIIDEMPALIKWLNGKAVEILPASLPPEPYAIDNNLLLYNNAYYFVIRNKNGEKSTRFLAKWSCSKDSLSFKGFFPFTPPDFYSDFNINFDVIGDKSFAVLKLNDELYNLSTIRVDKLPVKHLSTDYKKVVQGVRGEIKFYISDILANGDTAELIIQTDSIFKYVRVNTRTMKMISENSFHNSYTSSNTFFMRFKDEQTIYYADLKNNCIKQKLLY